MAEAMRLAVQEMPDNTARLTALRDRLISRVLAETAPSHVLTAMGLSPEEAYSSLRLTLGRDNTREDVDYIVSQLKNHIERLRQLPPGYGRKLARLGY